MPRSQVPTAQTSAPRVDERVRTEPGALSDVDQAVDHTEQAELHATRLLRNAFLLFVIVLLLLAAYL